MPKQKGNPKKGVALAVAVAILSVVAFAAAFYFLDGMSVIEDVLGGDGGEGTQSEGPPAGSSPDTSQTVPAIDGSSVTTMTVTPSGLSLPSGMPEEFALRVWQEQIDSQANLEHLASGDVERLVITAVVEKGDESVLDIKADFSDGTSSRGKMGFRRYADVWYVSWVSGIRRGETGGLADDTDSGTGHPAEGPLPDVDDVDVELLNTILREQVKSAEVTAEYATGVVQAVDIRDVVQGPGTVTLKLEMDESHEGGYGDAIMIAKEIQGRTHWFIARFTKTSS